MSKKKNKNVDKSVTKKVAKNRKPKQINYFGQGFWKKNLIPALIIFGLALGLYLSSMSFEYVLDDKIVYTENSFVKEGFKGTWNILSKDSFYGYFGEQKNLVAGGRYRPLSIVSFAWEYGLFGQNKAVSHFLNALFYALSCLLIFRVLSLMFYKRSSEDVWYLSIPFVAALLFALHPVHTEVVANVKGRDEIMALAGAMAAVYFSYKYLQKDSIFYLLLSAICFFLGTLSKENTLTFVLILPMTLWYFSKAPIKRILMASAPIALTTVLYLFMRYQIIGPGSSVEVKELMNNPFVGMTTSERFATIFYTLWEYLRLSFFPHPLTHDYYPYHIPRSSWSDVIPLMSIITYVGLGLLATWGFFKKALFSYCIWFFLFTLFITSNILFPIGTFMNERFIYMSSLGVCIFLAWLIAKYLPSRMTKSVPLGILALFVVGFTAKTLLRVPDWKNRNTLNESAIKVSPNSARANLFMGTAVFETKYLKTDDPVQKKAHLDKAKFHIDKALEIYPRYGSALTMRAGYLSEYYKLDRDLDRLLLGFEKVLQQKSNVTHIVNYCEYLNKRVTDSTRPKLINFYYRIGSFFADTRKDRPSAVKYLKYGLEIAPDNPQLNQAYQRVAN